MSEQEFFIQHRHVDTRRLLFDYSIAFHKGYFSVESVGPKLTDTELRAHLLHCLYHNKPKDDLNQPEHELIRLAATGEQPGTRART